MSVFSVPVTSFVSVGVSPEQLSSTRWLPSRPWPMAPSWLTHFSLCASMMLPGQGWSYCSSSLWTLFLLKMSLIFLHFHCVPRSFLLEGHTFHTWPEEAGFWWRAWLVPIYAPSYCTDSETIKCVSKVGLDLKSEKGLFKHQDIWNIHFHCAKLGPGENNMEGTWFSIRVG